MEREYAKEILFDGMTNKTMKTVKYEETPFRVMEHLKKRYIGKTYFKYSEEMTKLRELRLDPKSNILDHLGEVQRLMDRMATLGKQLDEYMKPAKLIGTLPREYDNIVETFLASRTPQDLNDPPNYELLEHALKTAYDRRQSRKEGDEKKTKQNGDDEEKAYHASGGRGRGRGSWRGRGERGRGNEGRGVGDGNDGYHNYNSEKGGGCYHCHVPGHYIYDCPHLGKRPPAKDEGDEQKQKRNKCCEEHVCCKHGNMDKTKSKRVYESDDKAY